MTKQHSNIKSGFTIIEVVLVLAIAGLIFLMVFIAYPALQRSQHDTQRTDDMARVQTALANWQNNHNNRLPGTSPCLYGAVEGSGIEDLDDDRYSIPKSDPAACEFLKEYMNAADSEDNTFLDPSGTPYSIVITENISGTGGVNSLTTRNVTANGRPSALDVREDENAVTVSTATDTSRQDSYVMWIIPGSTCVEDTAVPSARNDFSILMRMEGSGVKCTGNGH